MIDRELEGNIGRIFEYAYANRHEFITVDHLMLALIENAEARQILADCGSDLEDIKARLFAFVEGNTPKHELGAAVAGHKKPIPTVGFNRVLSHAMIYVQALNQDNAQLTGGNVLISLFREKDSHTIYLLQNDLKIRRKDILKRISALSKGGVSDGDESQIVNESTTNSAGGTSLSTSSLVLDKYAMNLNELALQGKLDPLIGRDKELDRMVQILCLRCKRNPLLLGEAGVGKTALAEGLAQRIVQGKIAQALKDAVVYSLDIASLVSGTKYRGDFEKRFKKFLSALYKNSNAILFIDEIHMLIGAGSTSGHSMDASNLLKPGLQHRSIRCIGATTYAEYKTSLGKDAALNRRFQKIDVQEPTVNQTYKVLLGIKPKFEEFHGVTYSRLALRRAADLAQRYIYEKFLPDKAIDVMDQAAASVCIASARKDGATLTVNASHVENVVSEACGVPIARMGKNDSEKLQNMGALMKKVIFGQDKALEQVVSATLLARSGLKDSSRPMGCFLFVGSTGVGKTEVARQLAMHTSLKLVRFDMTEYTEKHTVSRLIGAPPGYVGFDNGGQLTDAVTKTPYSLILLDEVEKAHPDVHNILLQVMDYGKLTDANGKKTDFSNCMLILTSNAGAALSEQGNIGFTSDPNAAGDFSKSVKKAFSPEFRNRLDAMIYFDYLNQDAIENILDRFLIELQVKLDGKKVELAVDTSVRAWLIQQGFSRPMGARPVRRIIEERITKVLAQEILFGNLKKGGKVDCTMRKGELHFSYTTPCPARKKTSNFLLSDKG